MRISRHYSDQHVDKDILETRVAIYEDQVRGWFHDQARILEKSSDHAGFVLLLVAISYVEGYAIFWKGTSSKGHSKEFFRDAFKNVFSIKNADIEMVDKAIDEFYDQARCALFHTGMIGGTVELSGKYAAPIKFEIDTALKEVRKIEINPHKVLDAIESHFSSYVMRLRNPGEKELRDNFDKAWSLRIERD